MLIVSISSYLLKFGDILTGAKERLLINPSPSNQNSLETQLGRVHRETLLIRI